MIRPIVHDPLFLSRKSIPASKEDLPLADDLRDTLLAHKDECVGMAANMIGESKRIIVLFAGMMPMVMLNPVILEKKKPYEAEEGCLSLAGIRKTTRYKEITVSYLDCAMQPKTNVFTGYTAQIIQHECDHLDGILI